MNEFTFEQIKEMSLYEKLFYIGAEIEPIKKKPKDPNSDFGFAHVTSDMILSEVKKLLIKYRVLLIPNTEKEEFQYLQGKKNCCYSRLNITYEIINIDNQDDTLTKKCVGHGVDTGERCVGKAYTYGEKYFILKLFNIETPKDDPDSPDNQNSGPNPGNDVRTEILKIVFYKKALENKTKEEIQMINEDETKRNKEIDKICALKTSFKGKDGKDVKGLSLYKLNNSKKRLETTYNIVSKDKDLKKYFEYAKGIIENRSKKE